MRKQVLLEHAKDVVIFSVVTVGIIVIGIPFALTEGYFAKRNKRKTEKETGGLYV